MRWLLLLPLAACAPHAETCLTFPLPPECTQGGGGGLSMLAGGDVPPRPEPGPAPAPEPTPEPPAPDPKPDPKPDHDDDKDDDKDDDDDEDHDHKGRDGKTRGDDDDDREHDDD